MSKGMKRFFVICAAAVVLGLVLAIVGYASGGIASMEKVSDRYEWFRSSSGDLQHRYVEKGVSFNKVVVKGELDVIIKKGDFENTRINYDEKYAAADIRVENGTLTASLTDESNVHVDLRFDDNSYPSVEIFVPEGAQLDEINCDLVSGDVEMYDISFARADINIDAGDVEGTRIKSGGLYINADYGDCDLSGEFTGETKIATDVGDVELDSILGEENYSISADADAGEISIGEDDYEYAGGEIKRGSGPNLIYIKCSTGDVELGFGGYDD